MLYIKGILKFLIAISITSMSFLQFSLIGEAKDEQIKRSIEFRLAKDIIESKEIENFVKMVLPNGDFIFVSKKVELNQDDVEEIKAERDPYGYVNIIFEFKKGCWEKLQDVTRRYINEKLALLIENTIVEAPVIKEPIKEGEFMIVVESKIAKPLLAILDLSLPQKEIKQVEMNGLIGELEAKRENINDITVTREIKTFINDKPLEPSKETKIIKGNKWRQEYGDEKYRMITFCDGKSVWMCSPLMRMVKMVDEEEAHGISSYWEIEPERIDGLIEFLKTEAQLLGKEKIGDKIGYKIKLGESGTNLYFDDEAAILKIEFSDTESSVIFSDFRELKGYGVFPYKTESFSKGKLYSIREVKDIKINQRISDDLFDPEKVEAQMQKEAPKTFEEMF